MRNDPRSHGLWERTAPAAPLTASLCGDVAADVAVVGAGFTGLSAALHLAEAGCDAVVLEAVEIGFGAAGRNVGLVNAGMWTMPDDLVAALGRRHGERLLEALGNGPELVFDLIGKHGIACEAERAGTLHCAVGPRGFAELRRRAVQWEKRRAPVHLLNAGEAAAKLGTTAYAGALLDLRAGTIQPLAYARGLAAAAMAAGARVFTASPVEAVEEAGGRWTLISARGRVSARAVIVATDAYGTGPWPAVREEQVRLPYFNFATAPLPPGLAASILPGRQGAWDTRRVLSSFRLDRGGRLVFGGVGALKGTGTAIHRGWAKRALRALFPQLGEVAFEAEWYGNIGMTAAKIPQFHRLAREVICVSGFNGRGIAPGTVFGRALAHHVAGKITDDDLPLPCTPLRKESFRAVREGVYEWGAQLVHLAGARL